MLSTRPLTGLRRRVRTTFFPGLGSYVTNSPRRLSAVRRDHQTVRAGEGLAKSQELFGEPPGQPASRKSEPVAEAAPPCEGPHSLKNSPHPWNLSGAEVR